MLRVLIDHEQKLSKALYCLMLRILPACCLLFLLGGCSSPEVRITDQVLQWPALDSVTDIRYQAIYDGRQYIFASERSLFSIADTNLSTAPVLLYTFHDSLWHNIASSRHPGKTAKKPEDIDHDFFRGMPDFYIHGIEHLDDSALLVLLTFNSITPRETGSVLNKDILTLVYNKVSGTVQVVDTTGNWLDIKGKDTVSCTLDPYAPIKATWEKDARIFYTAGCTMPTDSIWRVCPHLLAFNTKTGKEKVYYAETIGKTEKRTGELLTKDRRIYALSEEKIELLYEFDSAAHGDQYFRDAAFLPGTDNIVLFKIRWSETGNYTIMLYSLNGGDPKLIHEITHVTIPGWTLYSSVNGQLLFFYEKDARVHQITLSAS